LPDNINALIINIYKQAYYSDFVTFRTFVSESLSKYISFDTMGWTIHDQDGCEVSTFFSQINIENEMGSLMNINSLETFNMSSLKQSTTSILIGNMSHQLVAQSLGTESTRGHKIVLTRKKNKEPFTTDDSNLLELIFPHLIEGMTLSLVNYMTNSQRSKVIGLVDKNNKIIKASPEFLKIFSSKISQHKLRLNFKMADKISFKQSSLTFIINEFSEFKLIEEEYNRLSLLTKQEQRVLKLLATGISNKEIAEELKLSPSTINNHLTNIYMKLSVNSRVAALKVLNSYEQRRTFTPRTASNISVYC